jgi:hypothetical protein
MLVCNFKIVLVDERATIGKKNSNENTSTFLELNSYGVRTGSLNMMMAEIAASGF